MKALQDISARNLIQISIGGPNVIQSTMETFWTRNLYKTHKHATEIWWQQYYLSTVFIKIR